MGSPAGNEVPPRRHGYASDSMPTPAVAASRLTLTDLHGSLSDPLLDTMNFLNEIAVRYPDAVSFAPGRPYEEPFDAVTVAGYLHTYEQYLRQECGLSERQAGSVLFQYGRTKGQIHELIAATIRNDDGIEASPESVVVTVGAQEGMLLALRVLIRDPDDVLLVCSPCYVGITGAARLLDVAVEPVPEGIAGVDPEAVRDRARRLRAAGRRPRAVYLVPDFANPSGVRMPLAAREALLRVASDEDLLVLEDNPYGLFTRTDTQLPVLKRLDRDRRVIYLGSFAKTCFPGARVGYVVADQEVVAPDGRTSLLADELSKVKSMTTVNTSPLAQAAIGGMLLAGGCRLRTSNQDRIHQYRNRLDRLIGTLEQQFAEVPEVAWNVPDGGFFLVLSVPFTADGEALTRSARDHGVLWTPMSYFYLGDGGEQQIRLSCSYLDLAQIEEGVRRLHGFILAELA
jgi:(S)-3,5-dihydroxyphenylglycine transaminase